MFHRNPLPNLSRRDALRQLGAGFGTLGLAGLLADSASATDAAPNAAIAQDSLA
ncbi:MAG: hypothetical protein AAF483_24615 [Planctomycetota bacterium]